MAWFVVIAEHEKQKQIIEAVSSLFSTYAPLFLQTIVKNGRKLEKARFLFGRYFFVLMKEGWEAIQFMRGITRILLGPELKPLLVKDEVIDEIKAREIDGVIRANAGIRRGQKVMPRVGYLAGVEGKFYRSDRQRDVALFNMLGIETPVEFAPGVLEVLEPIRLYDEKKKKRRRQRRSRHRRIGIINIGVNSGMISDALPVRGGRQVAIAW